MCSSFVHLIEKEASPKTVISHVVECQKFYRNHHQPQGWLREKGGLKPQIPNDTRWSSWIATLETFLKNYKIYHEICIEHSDETPLNIVNMTTAQWYRLILEWEVTMVEHDQTQEFIKSRVKLLHPTITLWTFLFNTLVLCVIPPGIAYSKVHINFNV